ncbi:complex III assembly factor LYRM7-like [Ruditapes philippinarum]|uniref:complex III assembly factor LYRM7-like n=1 Tax=Ruditapes philippinarum TaxID=129788 RepID=UPI00295BA40D|nr:complex III assembly factor LYRM7-like [Ruditapes philippinarum]
MSLSNSRLRVLSIFKQLHKTRKSVFKGDTYALGVVREKINEEFRNNKDVNDSQKIEELLTVAKDAEIAVRTNIVQMEYNNDTGNYKAHITKDTEMFDNKEFDPNAQIPRRPGRPKCDDKVS